MRLHPEVRDLFTRAMSALFSPQRTFTKIPDGPIEYGAVAPYLVLSGIFWINLHGYLLFTRPVWDSLSREILYAIAFGLAPLLMWYFFSLVLWKACQMWGDGIYSLPQIERGVFCLVFIWILLPIFDIPHLFFPIPLIEVPIFGIHPIHFSHIIAVVIIPIELFYLFNVLFPRRIIFVILMAVVALPIAKFVLEDLYFLIEHLLYQLGWLSGKYDDSVAGAIGNVISFLVLSVIHSLVIGNYARDVRKIFFSVAILAIIMIPSVKVQKPLYPGFATDSGYLDSSDGIPKQKDFVFPDAFNLKSNESASSIRELKCIVQFLEETERVSGSKEFPWARCDIIPGSQVEGNRALLGQEWRLDGESRQETSWGDPQLLRQLNSEGNTIRLHIETRAGDVVSFSGIWIELDSTK